MAKKPEEYQSNVCILLNQFLIAEKQKNPKYSLRDLAKTLNAHPATISTILSGKRKISIKMAEKYLILLNFDPSIIRKTKVLYEKEKKQGKKRNISKDEKAKIELSIDEFSLVSEWYHFAILELMTVKNFVGTHHWISEQLHLPKRVIKSACERMVRLEMLGKDQNDKYYSTGKLYNSSDKIKNLYVRRQNIESLRLGITSLEKDPIKERDFCATTVATNSSKLEEAKVMIRNFRSELADFLNEGEKDSVYRINFQMIPLAKVMDN